ncbi:hypothetical protein MPER_05889, partial [Moniliophthora perniciosa FA553]
MGLDRCQAILLGFFAVAFPLRGWATSTGSPSVLDTKQNVTYEGVLVNGVEKFLNIPLVKTRAGKTILEPRTIRLSNECLDFTFMSPVPNQSEDCLKLKVVRPKGVQGGDKLPVMVWIYGGSLYNGNINDGIYEPDGLILQSVDNGLPVIFVAMNYRTS